MEWEGLFFTTREDVYRPSEDTFLLAQAVRAEVRPGDAFLEVGCGAGLVSMVAAQRGCKVCCTDLNPHAVALASHNARQNGLAVDALACDLLPLDRGDFDVVAFNPPYLPTAPDEVVPGPLNLAFDGGVDGNATVLRFADRLACLGRLPRAVLVVHSSLSDPAPLDHALAALGYGVAIAARQALSFEVLTVRRYTRASVV